jgi:hypothetical protein
MKFKLNVKVGDFAPSSRTMTSKGLLCRDAVLAVAPQVREYHPSELGLPIGDGKMIRMFTPADTLFSPSVMDNISDFVENHPDGNQVTPDNWRKFAIGDAKNIRREGDKLIGDLLVKDKAAIKTIQDGKKVELSLGYELAAELKSGKTDDGQDYDVLVTSMVGDHVALVKRGRGGSSVRIGDEKTEIKMLKIKLANGQTFDVEGDNLEPMQQAIDAQNAELVDAKALANTDVKIGEQTFKATDVVAIQAAFDAIVQQKTEAETKTAELEANSIKAEDVEKLAAERAETITDAKELKPDLEPSGKSLDEIIGETVTAHAGDAAVKAILGGIAIGDAKPEQLSTAFKVLKAIKPQDKIIKAHTGDSATAKTLNGLNNQNTITDAKAQAAQAKSNAWKNESK